MTIYFPNHFTIDDAFAWLNERNMPWDRVHVVENGHLIAMLY